MTHHHLKRSAMTLFELLLVMAIMVAIVGIAVPTIDSMVTSRRLGESITKLKNDLMEGRVTAMRTGQAQLMQATLNGNDYSITPWLGSYDSQNASLGATIQSDSGSIIETQSTSTGASTNAETESKGMKSLSSGVQFFGVETLIDTRNALAIQQTTGVVPTNGANGQGSNGLSSPLLLYPDGSTTTAQIILVDERGRRMAIQVRGVTGYLSSLRLTSVDPSSVANAASGTNGTATKP
jgi:Tfp pilus assembly protein FimT